MKIIFFLGVVLFFLFNTRNVFALDPSFAESATITYEVQSDFRLKANFLITITNKESLKFSPSFTFKTTGFNPVNLVIFESGIAAKILKQDNNSYKITFKNPAVGIGASKKIVVNFFDDSIIDHTDNHIHLQIPKVDGIQDFKDATVILKVPTDIATDYSFNPEPASVKQVGGFTVAEFDKENLTSPITADFGKFQDYSFKLIYPVDFFQKKDGLYEAAVPRDTAYQSVALNYFSLEPENIKTDTDGNFIIQFKNKPKENLVVEGVARVFLSPQMHENLTDKQRQQYVLPSAFWPSDSNEIKQIANKINSPKEIYDYVVSALNYDFKKTNRPVERLGAVQALYHPDEAICMEFTDLFIAIARAKGIPSREINGYAYTTNPEIQPLSLVSDILHSWPEYYDEKQKMWISVDPTWGKTTRGVDYFSQFDTGHISFVTHGLNATSPVTPGTLLISTVSKQIEVRREGSYTDTGSFSSETISTGIPFINGKLQFIVHNNKNVSLREQKIHLQSNYLDTEIVVPLVPPKGVVVVDIPGKFNLKIGRVINTSYQNIESTYKISVNIQVRNILFILSIVLVLTTTSIFIFNRYKYAHNKISN